MSITAHAEKITFEPIELGSLCAELLFVQPDSRAMLDRLLARRSNGTPYGAFAEIVKERCSMCNMSVATARVQVAKSGEFINCANCARFLYYPPAFLERPLRLDSSTLSKDQ